MSDQNMSKKTTPRKKRRVLAPSQKYEMWVAMLSGQGTQREIATKYGVDRSVVVSVAKARENAPSWYQRPVLRALVLASVPASVLVVVANAIFEFLMLHTVSTKTVAIVFALFMPTVLLGFAALTSYGLGPPRRTPAQPRRRRYAFGHSPRTLGSTGGPGHG